MRTRALSLLFVLSIFTILQSCKLERVNPQCPTIISLQPAAGAARDIISIKGNGFYSGLPKLYKIYIGDKALEALDVPDSNTLRFIVPAGTGSGAVSVLLASGISCNTSQVLNFTYYYTGALVKTLYNQLSSPQGLDLDNLGNVVVADSGSFQIKVIDTATGNLVSTYGKGGSIPGCDADALKLSDAHFYATDIEVDIRGNIYIAEPSLNMIRWIDPRSPDSVRTYAGKCNRAPQPTPADTVQRLTARLSRPYGVFRDEEGNALYFTDDLGIRKIFNALVHVPKKLDRSKGERYRGIEVSRTRPDKLGPVYYSDLGAQSSVSLPGNIGFLSDQGVSNIIVNGLLVSPVALTLDAHGNIFIVDYVANRIHVLYTNGIMKVLAGTGNIADNLVPVSGLLANFNRPSGIALAEKDGAVTWAYISDSKNNKVKAIRIE